ncbi:hypothetical protein IE81DRAFT_169913 [Ceraceosorus guamensis]|uniref:Uncharacterized protein n=1 Tax=Ceraceosorus guamensis TaxID=1522189 RepID=A0A316VW12_9BASI|nr:hypothetical protein IE81DRAFT_169913 [Ceraceosorus guamensis]PWN41632.1 hypothetical protein IE81DRAFT_169913 [Ceraceosorus guamensis]
MRVPNARSAYRPRSRKNAVCCIRGFQKLASPAWMLCYSPVSVFLAITVLLKGLEVRPTPIRFALGTGSQWGLRRTVVSAQPLRGQRRDSKLRPSMSSTDSARCAGLEEGLYA